MIALGPLSYNSRNIKFIMLQGHCSLMILVYACSFNSSYVPCVNRYNSCIVHIVHMIFINETGAYM